MKTINITVLIVLCLSACTPQPKPTDQGTEVTLDYKPIKLKMAQPPRQCSVTTELRYVQRNNIAGVEMGVAANENVSCKNSHGEYTLKVEFDNKEGDRQVMEFEESWSRSTNEALAFDLDYEIGFNTTLRSVKQIRSKCWCEENDVQEKN